jgi:purine-cytosine permease-like protein
MAPDPAAQKKAPQVGGFPLPRWRPLRILAGILLVVLGLFGFLPVLGFWMIPLGLIVLSVDFASVRRFRRRVAVAWGRRWGTPPEGRGP